MTTGSGKGLSFPPFCGGSAFNIPGRKNDAGETVVPVLMPEHPVKITPHKATKASRRIIPCIRTWLI